MEEEKNNESRSTGSASSPGSARLHQLVSTTLQRCRAPLRISKEGGFCRPFQTPKRRRRLRLAPSTASSPLAFSSTRYCSGRSSTLSKVKPRWSWRTAPRLTSPARPSTAARWRRWKRTTEKFSERRACSWSKGKGWTKRYAGLNEALDIAPRRRYTWNDHIQSSFEHEEWGILGVWASSTKWIWQICVWWTRQVEYQLNTALRPVGMGMLVVVAVSWSSFWRPCKVKSVKVQMISLQVLRPVVWVFCQVQIQLMFTKWTLPWRSKITLWRSVIGKHSGRRLRFLRRVQTNHL